MRGRKPLRTKRGHARACRVFIAVRFTKGSAAPNDAALLSRGNKFRAAAQLRRSPPLTEVRPEVPVVVRLELGHDRLGQRRLIGSPRVGSRLRRVTSPRKSRPSRRRTTFETARRLQNLVMRLRIKSPDRAPLQRGRSANRGASNAKDGASPCSASRGRKFASVTPTRRTPFRGGKTDRTRSVAAW